MKICIWEPFLLLICVGGNFFLQIGMDVSDEDEDEDEI